MIVFLSSIYFILGLGYLLIPSIALELGRPKDLLKGGLFFLLAIFLMIKKNTFNSSDLAILLFNNLLCFIFIAETNISRWNYLSDNEKNSFKNISSIKSKLSLFFDALKFGNKNFSSKFLNFNFTNKNLGKRVWIRSEKDDSKINNNNSSLNLVSKEAELTNSTKEDIIVDEYN